MKTVNLKKTLTSDAKGLLSFYEAANVRIHGEDVLEDAVAFTSHHLNRMVQELEPPLQCQVKRALEQPVHRGVPRLEARHYISFYERNEPKNDILLKLAKLDFNYLQNLYKKELHDLSRWWNELDLISKLPYARDRLVESYFWGTAFRFQPQHSYARIAITKRLKSASKEAIDWVMSEPNKALIASTRVCRHADDIGSDERWIAMRSNMVYQKKKTVDKFKQLCENAWKDFNTEWSTEISTVSKDMMEQLLNYARAAEVNYRNGRDAYAHPQKIAGQIAAVFMHPIAI
ncbi:UNVERIFIED_CONTAM: Germacrene A synthase [Sesamum radiatum]|uniref:Germacrene A synthase n=1 Tax=Sesamum radiatum TaxID=300843 RepID=A0AAW2UWR0_SESRA